MEVEVNGHKIVFYGSSETLPIKRYQRFNKYLMIQNDVGSTFEDYDKRSARAIEFLRKDMKEKALEELINRRQMVFNSFEEYVPRNFALAIMVISIDEEKYTDYTEDGLQKIIDRLDEIGYTQATLEEHLMEVKKSRRGIGDVLSQGVR